jgi:hypothetical protein
MTKLRLLRRAAIQSRTEPIDAQIRGLLDAERLASPPADTLARIGRRLLGDDRSDKVSVCAYPPSSSGGGCPSSAAATMVPPSGGAGSEGHGDTPSESHGARGTEQKSPPAGRRRHSRR